MLKVDLAWLLGLAVGAGVVGVGWAAVLGKRLKLAKFVFGGPLGLVRDDGSLRLDRTALFDAVLGLEGRVRGVPPGRVSKVEDFVEVCTALVEIGWDPAVPLLTWLLGPTADATVLCEDSTGVPGPARLLPGRLSSLPTGAEMTPRDLAKVCGDGAAGLLGVAAEPTELFLGIPADARRVREEMAAAFGDEGVTLLEAEEALPGLAWVALCDLLRTTLRFGLG